MSRPSLTDKADLKAAVVANESNVIKEKPQALHWDNMKGALKARPNPLKAPSTEYAN